MELNLIINGLLLGWLIANFEPLQSFLTKFIKPKISNKLSYFKTAMSCFKCLAFWVTLIITFDIFSAAASALIAYTYEKIMNGFKTYL